ncbi:hypothetical protein HNY73_018523 [Argiope bruennichi]|uniref:Uncharacterized protein n=1 Tax=Argiope bruennichi TaxID=94029 RepID=A0A8T0EEC0_ARGBR|nr:hypothetical protein HNY73_018523 [Argiope bruennichi]
MAERLNGAEEIERQLSTNLTTDYQYDLFKEYLDKQVETPKIKKLKDKINKRIEEIQQRIVEDNGSWLHTTRKALTVRVGSNLSSERIIEAGVVGGIQDWTNIVQFYINDIPTPGTARPNYVYSPMTLPHGTGESINVMKHLTIPGRTWKNGLKSGKLRIEFDRGQALIPPDSKSCKSLLNHVTDSVWKAGQRPLCGRDRFE